MSTDAITLGTRFNTTLAQEEVAYCQPLLTSCLPRLEKQGLRARHVQQLEALDTQVSAHEQAVADALAAQKRATEQVDILMDQGTTALGTTANLADEALGETNPAALEGLANRSPAQASVSSMLEMLRQYAGFVKAYLPAFVAIEEGEQAAKLEALAAALSSANKAQEKAKQVVAAAEEAVARSRGEIYLLCGKVYRAGRVAFRGEDEMRAKFKYYAMIRSNGKKTAGKQSGAQSVAARNPVGNGVAGGIPGNGAAVADKPSSSESVAAAPGAGEGV